MEKEVMSYIGRAECGCIVACAVDNPEHRKETAKDIRDWIRDWLIIERVTIQFVRDIIGHVPECEHNKKKLSKPKKQKQEGLFK